MLTRTRTALLVALALTSTAVHAQTPDVIFGAWSARPPEIGSRPGGLGGAFTAVADDSRAAVTNPAGVALVPHTELAGATSDAWAVAAFALRPADLTVAPRPGGGAPPLPCPGRLPARPWAVAVFAERAGRSSAHLAVPLGVGRVEEGSLSARNVRLGAAVARGLTSWLNLGASLSWNHLSLEGGSSVGAADGPASPRTIVDGDPSKATLVVGALAVFGPQGAHSAPRLGLSYRGDLSRWSVRRRGLDAGTGVVGPPTRVDLVEPPVLSAGLGWRFLDYWLVSGQVDYVWYRDVLDTLRGNAGAAGQPFQLGNGVEPRLGVELSKPLVIGGYFKLRAGLHRASSGRLRYEGEDAALRLAFPGTAPSWRASAGASLFGEFYDKAARLDLDLSQLSLGSSGHEGGRRFSIGLTVRL